MPQNTGRIPALTGFKCLIKEIKNQYFMLALRFNL
jgi:hypothetical protein